MNEIFWKDVTYNSIKSRKKQDFTLSLEDTFLEKSQARRLKWFCNFVKFRINNILQKKLFAG